MKDEQIVLLTEKELASHKPCSYRPTKFEIWPRTCQQVQSRVRVVMIVMAQTRKPKPISTLARPLDAPICMLENCAWANEAPRVVC